MYLHILREKDSKYIVASRHAWILVPFKKKLYITLQNQTNTSMEHPSRNYQAG